MCFGVVMAWYDLYTDIDYQLKVPFVNDFAKAV